jgi:Ca-activated chloride channel family protein
MKTRAFPATAASAAKAGVVAALAAAMILGLAATAARADGMIVPIRPELRVRGNWAVKYHRVDIKVRDQVALVSVDEEFVNTGSGMIEVEYFFPVPPDAAIDSMTLVVNGKEFEAKLLKADEARRIYEDIVRAKKDPALLEYAGFGLYRTRAFPLEAGKPARVVVTYKCVCKKDHNLLEVWYPLNTEKFSSKAIEEVEVVVDAKTSADISTVYSPSHDLRWDFKDDDPRHVVATYKAKDVLPLADFQAFIKTTEKDVGATLLTYQPYGDKDGYFMLLVSPNPKLGANKVVPKDVVLVLDRSGSMAGKKVAQVRQAVDYVLKNLHKEDRFNVISFNDQVDSVFEALAPANIKKVDEARDWADRMEASGGTNIHDALVTAFKMLPRVADRGYTKEGRDFEVPSRPAYILFLTDGLPTIGKTDEKDILKDADAANERGARLFAFGVGYDVNVRLLDRLSGENHGKSDYVKEKEAVDPKITSLYNKIKSPVMTELTMEVQGLRLRDKYPRELGDLFDGGQIVVVGRYDGRDVSGLSVSHNDEESERLGRQTTVVIKGTFEGRAQAFEYPVTVNAPGRDTRYEFVEKLWAMRRIGYLLDQVQLHGESGSKELIDEVIRLSRDYGIITPYTSFLADERHATSDTRVLGMRGAASMDRLAKDSGEAAGQMAAESRLQLNSSGGGGGYFRGGGGSGGASGGGVATGAPAALRPTEAVVSGPAASSPAGRDSVVVYGNADQKKYEEGKVERVEGVRQVGNQALYRRGQVWIANNAADVDLEKSADKIKTIDRYTDEYFALVRQNTTDENQVLATQKADEELVIKLRDQVYRIR